MGKNRRKRYTGLFAWTLVSWKQTVSFSVCLRRCKNGAFLVVDIFHAVWPTQQIFSFYWKTAILIFRWLVTKQPCCLWGSLPASKNCCVLVLSSVFSCLSDCSWKSPIHRNWVQIRLAPSKACPIQNHHGSRSQSSMIATGGNAHWVVAENCFMTWYGEAHSWSPYMSGNKGKFEFYWWQNPVAGIGPFFMASCISRKHSTQNFWARIGIGAWATETFLPSPSQQHRPPTIFWEMPSSPLYTPVLGIVKLVCGNQAFQSKNLTIFISLTHGRPQQQAFKQPPGSICPCAQTQTGMSWITKSDRDEGHGFVSEASKKACQPGSASAFPDTEISKVGTVIKGTKQGGSNQHINSVLGDHTASGGSPHLQSAHH